VKRTAGIHALKEVHDIVDESNREAAARATLLRGFFRFAWIVMLLAFGLLARYLGGF